MEKISKKEVIVSKLISDVQYYMARYGVPLDDAIADYDMFIEPEYWNAVRAYFTPVSQTYSNDN